MRTVLLALATSVTIFATGVTGLAAGDHRYCLQGEEFGGAGDCSFTSYQQCQATASGRTASCGANPVLTNASALTNRARLRHH